MFTSMIIPSLFSLSMTVFAWLWLYLWALNIEFELNIFFRVSILIMMWSIWYIFGAYIMLIPYFEETTYNNLSSIIGITSNPDDNQRYRLLFVYVSNILIYFCLLMYYKNRQNYLKHNLLKRLGNLEDKAGYDDRRTVMRESDRLSTRISRRSLLLHKLK